MRRRETTLDPAVAAELEALETALSGDSAAEPDLAALVRDVRANAPAMAPAFRARLDGRVERGFPKPTRSRPRRNLVPALAVAGCVLAALVAVALVGGGSGDDSASSTPAVSAQSEREQQAQGDAASGAGSSGAAAPSTTVAPRTRRVERTTRLALATTDVQRTADDVVSATQSVGGFVQSSQVATTNGRGSASFTLRVPSARLDDAVARLSKLGHVRSLEQSAQDITGAYDGAAARLAEARAERRALLRALAKATTAQEISSLRARIADNRRELQRYQREFESVRNRANFATVEVDVTSSTRKGEPVPGGGGSWSPGDAARDAVRVLEVSAGVALVGLAVLVPLALLGAAGGLAAGAWRRRRREAALQT